MNELKEKILKYAEDNYNGSLKRFRDSNLGKFLSGSEVKIIRDFVDVELQTPTSRMLYCFLNDITSQPKCPCGENVKFDEVRKRFRPYCSVKCRIKHYELATDKRKKTCLERYGATTYIVSEQGIEHRKRVCLDKYGVDSFSKTNEFKDMRKKW